MLGIHYCQTHDSKFYRNEKDVNGEHKVWYSHKIVGGTGFCVEKDTQNLKPEVAQKSIFMCNAMNNATALASGGIIDIDQIGSYYKKILSELIQTQ